MWGPSRRLTTLALRRRRPGRRLWALESLEGRALLSGNPTVYTVTDPSDSAADMGSLRHAIAQANVDTNPDGSRIEFDPTVFSSPQTITLSSTLELSGTAGPEVIEGPGAGLVTISGNQAVGVFQVDTGATADFTGLSISGGSAVDGRGGGIANRGTLTITSSTLSGNSAVRGGGGIAGGGIANSGTLTITGSTLSGN